jgi:hypothetical protein
LVNVAAEHQPWRKKLHSVPEVRVADVPTFSTAGASAARRRRVRDKDIDKAIKGWNLKPSVHGDPESVEIDDVPVNRDDLCFQLVPLELTNPPSFSIRIGRTWCGPEIVVARTHNDGRRPQIRHPLTDRPCLIMHRGIREGVLEIAGDEEKVEERRLRRNPIEPLMP